MSELEALRAEVADLRKLVMELMARGITVTHVHSSPPVSPYYTPRPSMPQTFPWSPYQGPTCISVGQALPVQGYNGDRPQ